MTIHVTDFRLLQRPITTQSGSTIIAYFSAHDSDIEFKGLTLVRKPDGELGIWTPTFEDRSRAERRASGRAVYLRAGGTMRGRFLEAGIAAYEALAGAPLEQPGIPKIPALAASWS